MPEPADGNGCADHLRTRLIRGADRVTVVLSGDLDRLAGPTVVGIVDGIAACPVPCIDIDLTQVDFLDLGGLRSLLHAHRRAARAGIPLVVHNPREYVRWLLDVTGATEILTADRSAPPAPTEGALSWVNRPAEDTSFVRAGDRDLLADERERLLDERQRRISEHQQWEDIREDLADQREADLERRDHDN